MSRRVLLTSFCGLFVFLSVNLISLHWLLYKKNSDGSGFKERITSADCRPSQDGSRQTEVKVSVSARTKLPESTAVPRIVHVLWCSRTEFRFSNYLSVLSAVRYLEPDRIIFHYGSLPRTNRYNYYDDWFEDLQQNLAIFHTIRISQDGVCGTMKTRREFLSGVLNKTGGVYVEESTVFTQNMDHLFGKDMTFGIGYNGVGYVAAAVGRVDPDVFSVRRVTQPCPDFDKGEEIDSCFSIRKRVHPRTFWGRQDLVGRTVNTLMYGSEVTPTPRQHAVRVIPNIGHVMWLKGKQVDYLFYLSCMSLVYVAKVDLLFIHGDAEPSGRYWRLLKPIQKIRFIRIVIPDVIFNITIRRPTHISDVFRALVLNKYGGVYSDVDVIWTRPISDELLRHDAVASYDWAKAFYPFPDYLNLGVSMARRGSRFWQAVVSSFADFRDDVFGYNGLLKPYKIYERRPDTLLVDSRLQVMCFKSACHPTWNATERDIDWRTDTYSYHWTWPTPTEFHNQSVLLQSNSTWAQIGRNVLAMAGII